MSSRIQRLPRTETIKLSHETLVDTKTSGVVRCRTERLLSYRRIDDVSYGNAIVEADAGQMKFYEQESGEFQWFPFTPCVEERAEVERILKQGGIPKDGKVLVDVRYLKRAR